MAISTSTSAGHSMNPGIGNNRHSHGRSSGTDPGYVTMLQSRAQ